MGNDQGLGGGWAGSDPHAPEWGNAPLPVDDWLTAPDVNTITGEVLEGEVVVPPRRPLATHSQESAEDVVTLLGAAGADAIDWLRSPDLVQNLAGGLRAALRVELDDRAAHLRGVRPEGRATESTVAPELAFLADADVVLSTIGSLFSEAGKQARDMAGELVLDVLPESKLAGTASVKVGAASGEVKVTRTQNTKPSVRDEEVVDVLVADLITDRNSGLAPDQALTGPLRHYAAGAREGITALVALLGPLPWRTTDLEKLQRRLESQERHDLAIRLGHAFGRVASGNPRTTIERKADQP